MQKSRLFHSKWEMIIAVLLVVNGIGIGAGLLLSSAVNAMQPTSHQTTPTATPVPAMTPVPRATLQTQQQAMEAFFALPASTPSVICTDDNRADGVVVTICVNGEGTQVSRSVTVPLAGPVGSNPAPPGWLINPVCGRGVCTVSKREGRYVYLYDYSNRRWYYSGYERNGE